MSCTKRKFECKDSDEEIIKKCEYFKKLVNNLLHNLIDFTFELNKDYHYCSLCNKFSYTIDQNRFIDSHKTDEISTNNYKIVKGICELCYRDIQFTYGLEIKTNFYYKNLDKLNKRKPSSKDIIMKLCKKSNDYLIGFNFDYISDKYCLYCKRRYWLDSQDKYIYDCCNNCSVYLEFIKKKKGI